MNIFRTAAFRAIALSLALPLSAAVLVGCDVGSVDSTSAVLSDTAGTIYNFAGLYLNKDTNGVAQALVTPNDPKSHPSGKAITSLRLLQYGEVLEAYDSAGLTWYGNITSVQSGSAQFSLRGRTTVGMSTEIAGTLTYANQESAMNATWIEPAFYGSIFATATVSPASTNTPPADEVTISPDGTIILSPNGDFEDFIAGGGNGTYSWVFTGTGGSLDRFSGSTTRFIRSTTGSGRITVTSNGKTASALISCP